MKFAPALASLSVFAALLMASQLAHADDVEINDDSVTSQQDSIQLANDDEPEQEVVVVRKPSKRRKVVVVQDDGEDAGNGRNSVGSSVDSSINKKLDDARGRMEDKLSDAIDRLQINVGDNSQQQVAAPAQVVAVQDDIVNRASANEKVYAEVPASEVSAVSTAEVKDEELKGRVGIYPIFGVTSLNSTNYSIDSRYTMGIGLEVDITDNFSASMSYRYSQFDVSLGSTNPVYGYYNGGYSSNNTQKLEYNQNVVDATGRFYLLPRNYRFRFFIGAGVGYNKGYLNYNQKTLDSYNSNPYYASTGQLNDYEVSSVLGILETGGELQLSKSLAIGANFKYHSVMSSSENQPLNNNGFVTYGYSNNSAPTDKNVVGGSLKENSFYSLLGTVKLSF